MTVMIPKELGHIWIGPRPAPLQWMQSYHDTHPDWNYTLYDNEYLSNRRFRTQSQINEYMKRGEYAGAADLLRNEILFEKGGFIAGADSISRRNTDELWDKSCIYGVYENEIVRPGIISPVLAGTPGNSFLASLISELEKVPFFRLGKAWKTTGNLFVTEMMRSLKPEIVIFPSHFFIPEHFLGQKYHGDGPIYADQRFGETTGGYEPPPLPQRIKMKLGRYRSSILRRIFVAE